MRDDAPPAIESYCKGRRRVLFAKLTHQGPMEEILMHNTGIEPEAVEIYSELGESHALGAKFTH